jgi:hypothetical protein
MMRVSFILNVKIKDTSQTVLKYYNMKRYRVVEAKLCEFLTLLLDEVDNILTFLFHYPRRKASVPVW